MSWYSYDDDSGAPEVRMIQADRPVRARRAHRCSRCFRPIEAGEVYLRTVCTVDGEISVEVRHSSTICYLEADADPDDMLAVLREEQAHVTG